MAQATPHTADVNLAEDPTITSGVFGNPLDQYDLPQFQLHLYMAQDNDPDSDNIFTIARTGVTPTQIDNVVIKTYANGVSAGELNFSLSQPGHASLLDDMLKAREPLGIPATSRPILFLTINFTGYTNDLEDEDQGGKIQNIAGPYRYKLILSKIAVTINSEGSTYEVSTIIHNYLAYKNTIYRVPTQIKITGPNIQKGLEDFRTKLLEYYRVNQKSYSRRDDFIFDTSDKSLELYLTDVWSQETKLTPAAEGTTEIYHEDNIEISGTTLNIKEGASFYGVIRAMFSLSPKFRKDVTKRTDPNDPESVAVDNTKTFVKWFRFITAVDELDYDRNRQDYARKYTFKTIVFDTARTDIDIPQANSGLPDDVLIGRFDEVKLRGLLKKAYYYIFTGKNDQITSLEIKFDSGEVLFNQPTAYSIPSAQFGAGQSSRDTRSAVPPLRQPQGPIDSSKLTPGAKSFLQSIQSGVKNDGAKLTLTRADVESLRAVGIVSEQEFSGDTPTIPFLSFGNSPPVIPERGMVQGQQIPDLVEGGAYYGFSNTVFGHLAYQHYLAAMGKTLIALTMTVRGDPWYLGKKPNGDLLENSDPGTDAFNDPLAGCFLRDHTFFFLKMASPRFPDSDVDDEDKGTGYWNYGSQGGMVTSYSGIYLLTQVTNSFSGGIFTSELSGQLMLEFKVDKIVDRVETPPPLSSGGLDSQQPENFYTIVPPTRPSSSSTTPTSSDVEETLLERFRRVTLEGE